MRLSSFHQKKKVHFPYGIGILWLAGRGGFGGGLGEIMKGGLGFVGEGGEEGEGWIGRWKGWWESSSTQPTATILSQTTKPNTQTDQGRALKPIY